MIATNDITGQSIMSRSNSKEYEDNYDRIFGKKTRSIILEEKQSNDDKWNNLFEAVPLRRSSSVVDDVFYIDGREPNENENR